MLSRLLLFALTAASLFGQSVAEEGLKEVRFQELSDSRLGLLGSKALAIRRDDWKHAETENFVLHYLDAAIAKQVAVEAEFFHRTISADLNRSSDRSGRKGRVIIFDPATWSTYRAAASLDPLTGGAHLEGELVMGRDADKAGGVTLGHEIAHLTLYRWFPGRLPLWLDEGYAEYISNVLLAAFYKARGMRAKPRLHSLSPADFIPLERLVAFTSYPSDASEMMTFYVESQRLVAFLRAIGKENFTSFLEAMAKGSQFESALDGAFSGRFSSRRELEEKFKEELFREAR